MTQDWYLSCHDSRVICHDNLTDPNLKYSCNLNIYFIVSLVWCAIFVLTNVVLNLPFCAWHGTNYILDDAADRADNNLAPQTSQ